MARTGMSIEIKGVGKLTRALRALEELDAPELKATMGRISRIAEGEISQRAPGSMPGRVNARAAKKFGRTITLGEVKHPGAKSMEFGRTKYYTGYRGRNQKSGTKVTRSGQKARPFIGIKTGKQSMEAMRGPIEREIREGIAAVWARDTGGPD